MKARLAAIAIASALMVPAAGLAAENPWTAIKKLFHEPVSELKQQLEQLRQPPKAATAAKRKGPGAKSSPAKTVVEPETSEPETSSVPTPVAKPAPEALAAAAPEIPTFPAPSGAAEAPPGQAEMVPLAAAVEEPDEFETALAPIPRPRPAIGIPYAADVGPLSPAVGSVAAIGALVAPSPSLIRPPPAVRSNCGAELARLGVEASAIAPISEGVCGVPEPVAVAALGGGVTDLTTKAIVGCQLAEAFANWLRDDVQPSARKSLAGEVVGVRVAASYTCRTRNGVEGAKLSEHGRGNAIDISAFNVSGRGWIEVGGDHPSDEARFLKTIRTAACGPFKTVLGPGTDAHHSDHFHLDRAKRRKGGPSRGLYCK